MRRYLRVTLIAVGAGLLIVGVIALTLALLGGTA